MSEVVQISAREAHDDAVLLERQARQLELQGNDVVAIRQLERALLIRAKEFAGRSRDQPTLYKKEEEEVALAAERLVVKCNTAAVKSFKSDDYQTAVMLLDNAMRLTEDHSTPLSHFTELREKLRGTTLNNYGCMERRRGRLQASLHCMLSSLHYGGQQSPATYLNISAVQTQMGQHQEAVGSARRAIGLLETAAKTATDSHAASEAAGLLCIAHHNLAMALEQVDPSACIASYETALQLAKRDLGSDSATTATIERNLNHFRQKHSISRPGTLPPLQAPDVPLVHPFALRTIASRGHHGAAATPPQSPARSARLPHLDAGSTTKSTLSGSRPGQPQARPATHAGSESHQRMPALRPQPPTAKGKTDTANHGKANSGVAPRRSESSKPLLDSAASSRTPVRQSPLESSVDPTVEGGKAGGASAANSLLTANNLTGTTSGGTSRPSTKPEPPTPSKGKSTQAFGGRRPSTVLSAKDGEEGGGTEGNAAAGPKHEDVVSFMLNRLVLLLQAEDAHELRYKSALMIQCAYRRHLAVVIVSRKKAQRAKAIKLRMLLEKASARRLVRFFLALVKKSKLQASSRKQAQEDRHRRNTAATKIQRLIRSHLARKEVARRRTYRQRSRKAVVTLQCWFRSLRALLLKRSLRRVAQQAMIEAKGAVQRDRSAQLIQRTWRGFVANKAVEQRRGVANAARERDRKNRQSNSTTRLQSWWRGILTRRQFAVRLATHRARQAKLRLLERRTQAAYVLQGFARGIITRYQLLPVTRAREERRAAARLANIVACVTKLQCFFRLVAARRRRVALQRERDSRRQQRRQAMLSRLLRRVVDGYRSRLALAKALHQALQRERERIASMPSLVSPSNSNALPPPPPALPALPLPSSTPLPISSAMPQPTTTSSPTATNQLSSHNEEERGVSTDSAPRAAAVTVNESAVQQLEDEEEVVAPRTMASTPPPTPPPVQGAVWTTTEAEQEGFASQEPSAPREEPQNVKDTAPVEEQDFSVVAPHIATVDDRDEERAPTPKNDATTTVPLNPAVVHGAVYEAHRWKPQLKETPSSSSSAAHRPHSSSTAALAIPDAASLTYVPRGLLQRQQVAGAKIVRVARGCLARKYARGVKSLVQEYIDGLVFFDEMDYVSSHPLKFDQLEKVEPEVAPHRDRLRHRDSPPLPEVVSADDAAAREEEEKKGQASPIDVEAKRRKAAAMVLVGFVKMILAKKRRRQIRCEIDRIIAEAARAPCPELAEQLRRGALSVDKAALRIQCAVRVRRATKETAIRRAAKLQRWAAKQEQDAIDAAAAAAADSSSLQQGEPAAEVSTPSLDPADAACRIQCRVRVHQAKQKTATLREERKQKWDAKRISSMMEEEEL